MEQAAAIFVPYTTAYATIISLGKAKKGQIILIHGAAGGDQPAACAGCKRQAAAGV